MNCHGNNHNKGEDKKHNPIKHMLMMVLCCGLPLLIVGLLPFISFGGPGFKAALAAIAPFICPIMMLFMIPMMFKNMKKGSCCHGEEEKNKEIL